MGNVLLSGLMADAGLGDPYDIRQASDPTDPLGDILAEWLNNPKTQALVRLVFLACYLALFGIVST